MHLALPTVLRGRSPLARPRALAPGVELHVRLSAGATMSLVPDRTLVLTCLSGCTWATADHVPKDEVLAPGTALTLQPLRRVFISGLPECELRIGRSLALAAVAGTRPEATCR